jgi:GntR family transcriptional regulator
MFGVSRPTVRRALDALAGEGLVVRRHGMGSFVTKVRIEQPMGRVIGFSERMRRIGMVPGSRVLEQDVIEARLADPTPVQALGLEPGGDLIRLSRVRFANDDAIILETIHLPHARFPGLDREDLATLSLYAVLQERYGVTISFIRETLEPVILSAHEAGLLRTQPGTPGMLARIVTYDQHGAPVEHSLSLVRGDRCQYEIAFAPSDVGATGQAGWHIRQTQLEVDAAPSTSLP